MQALVQQEKDVVMLRDWRRKEIGRWNCQRKHLHLPEQKPDGREQPATATARLRKIMQELMLTLCCVSITAGKLRYLHINKLATAPKCGDCGTKLPGVCLEYIHVRRLEV